MAFARAQGYRVVGEQMERAPSRSPSTHDAPFAHNSTVGYPCALNSTSAREAADEATMANLFRGVRAVVRG